MSAFLRHFHQATVVLFSHRTQPFVLPVTICVSKHFFFLETNFKQPPMDFPHWTLVRRIWINRLIKFRTNFFAVFGKMEILMMMLKSCWWIHDVIKHWFIIYNFSFGLTYYYVAILEICRLFLPWIDFSLLIHANNKFYSQKCLPSYSLFDLPDLFPLAFLVAAKKFEKKKHLY